MRLKSRFFLFFDKIDEIIFTNIHVLRLMLKKHVQLCVTISFDYAKLKQDSNSKMGSY